MAAKKKRNTRNGHKKAPRDTKPRQDTSAPARPGGIRSGKQPPPEVKPNVQSSPSGDVSTRGGETTSDHGQKDAGQEKSQRRGRGGGVSRTSQSQDGRFGFSCDVGSLKQQGVRYTLKIPPLPTHEEPQYDARYRSPAEGHGHVPSDGQNYYSPPRAPGSSPSMFDGRSSGLPSPRSRWLPSPAERRRLRDALRGLLDRESETLESSATPRPSPPTPTGTPARSARVEDFDWSAWGLDREDFLPEAFEQGPEPFDDPATAFADPEALESANAFDPDGAFGLPELGATGRANEEIAGQMAGAFALPPELAMPAELFSPPGRAMPGDSATTTEPRAANLNLEQRVLNDPRANTVDHQNRASDLLHEPLLSSGGPTLPIPGLAAIPSLPSDGLMTGPDLDQRVLSNPLIDAMGAPLPGEELPEDLLLDMGGLERKLFDPAAPPGSAPAFDPWQSLHW